MGRLGLHLREQLLPGELQFRFQCVLLLDSDLVLVTFIGIVFITIPYIQCLRESPVRYPNILSYTNPVQILWVGWDRWFDKIQWLEIDHWGLHLKSQPLKISLTLFEWSCLKHIIWYFYVINLSLDITLRKPFLKKSALGHWSWAVDRLIVMV